MKKRVTKTPHHRKENEDKRFNCSVPEYDNDYCLIISQHFPIELIVSCCNCPFTGIECWPPQGCREKKEVSTSNKKTSRQSEYHETIKPKVWIGQNIPQEDN